MKKLFTVINFIFPLVGFAQSTFIPMGNDAYWMADRYEILSGQFLPLIHSSNKQYLRDDVLNSMDSIHTTIKPNDVDKSNLQWLKDDNSEWVSDSSVFSKNPLWNTFYKTKADLYSHQSNDFMLKLNPVLGYSLGKEENNSETMFDNVRGIEMRSWIDKKVGVYLFISENQYRGPQYVQDEILKLQAVPNEGYFKEFHTTGVDFLTTHGYIDFKVAKFINVTFGQDKNFIGNGYRSLFLSDFSEDYLFLKLNTQVWKLNYENIFADLTANFERGGDTYLPRKYAAFHHLSLNVTKFLNVGLFEGIIFSRNNGYELTYLNPIIFYRAVEQGLGSPDNAVIGLDYKANFLHHFSVYGQLLIDDLNIVEFKKFSGYWGDKLGLQTGVKYMNAFNIPNLDLQIENNIVRPYTYSHVDSLANYSNYNQPLAHPLGANFNEWIGIVRYQPISKLLVTGRFFKTLYGQDTGSSNYGGNILLISDEATIPHIYDNSVGQGIATHLTMADILITYQLKHQLYLNLEYIYRKTTASVPEIYFNQFNTMTNYLTIGFRLNFAQRQFSF